MLRALVLVTSVFVLGAGAAEASAAFTIRTEKGAVTRIGPMKTAGVEAGRVMDATAAFGPASAVVPMGDVGCRMRWSALGLRATFANFGGGDPCGAETGRLQQATIRAPEFRTSADLRVGDAWYEVREKHPNAKRRGEHWVVKVAHSIYAGRRIPTVKAIVEQKRVAALRLWAGAAGD